MTPSSRRIFLSYRRDDCAAHAGWLAETLRRQDAGDIFLDVDTIGLGENFVKRIEREIERCDVVLVLIGRDWLTLTDADGQPRILDELDWVHLEIKAALERDVPVVPVLVEGARMPRPQQLPEAISALAYRNGFELSPSRWEADVSRLVSLLPHAQVTAEPPCSSVERHEAMTQSGDLTAPLGRQAPESPNRHGTDIVVVAAGRAYDEYLATSAYICQNSRSFRRGTTRLGFYGSKHVRREFPLILHRRDHVLFTLENAKALRDRAQPFDPEIATLIDGSLQADAGLIWERTEGIRYEVLCLTAPDDARTLRLDQSIDHPGSSAWTQHQRYISSSQLESQPRTTDEL